MSKNLTEEQKRIVSEDGDLVVIAGPGTGKTFTLIEKIRHLLENKNINSDKIVVLTYSLKVSQELKTKLDKNGFSCIKVDTFHGLAYDLWRDYFQKSPVLISEREKNKIIKILFPKEKNPLKSSKNKKIYFDYLKSQNLLDFELLLYEVSRLPLKDFEGYYFIIDEFQDLSSEILEFLILFQKANFILFGDPNQSIYGFRGVNLFHIYQFLQRFKPEIKILTLSLSFRCPQNILKFAEKFKNAPWEKIPYHSLKKNGILQGFFFSNVFEEKEFVIKLVKDLLGGLQLESQKYHSISPKDIFILSRIKNIFLPLKEKFLKEGIPVNFVEEEANESLEKINEFLKKVEGSIVSVEDLIKVSDPQISSFLKNIWNLALYDKEKFLSYLKRVEIKDFINPYKEGVNFLSIHGAKGLEAEYVILLGTEEGLIPLKIFDDTIEDEEKRLIYVALTRAKKGFYFTVVKERKIFNFTVKGISPYFKELPLNFISPKGKKPKQIGIF